MTAPHLSFHSIEPTHPIGPIHLVAKDGKLLALDFGSPDGSCCQGSAVMSCWAIAATSTISPPPIGSNGALTGYGGRIERKRWLLEHERSSAGSGP